MDDALRCQYRSKPCRNQRSLKTDGTHHRLCMAHRERANEAQRRWHARRRQRHETEDASSDSPTPRPKRRRLEQTKEGALMDFRKGSKALESIDPPSAATVSAVDVGMRTLEDVLNELIDWATAEPLLQETVTEGLAVDL